MSSRCPQDNDLFWITSSLAWSCRCVADVRRHRVLFGMSHVIPNVMVCEYPREHYLSLNIDTEVHCVYSDTRKKKR